MGIACTKRKPIEHIPKQKYIVEDLELSGRLSETTICKAIENKAYFGGLI